ncbi:MAG: hypothetical protein ACYCO3_13025, partial [Mycobacteriales bacterium]
MDTKLSATLRVHDLRHLVWLRNVIGDQLRDDAEGTTGAHAYRAPWTTGTAPVYSILNAANAGSAVQPPSRVFGLWQTEACARPGHTEARSGFEGRSDATSVYPPFPGQFTGRGLPDERPMHIRPDLSIQPRPRRAAVAG